MYVTLGGTGGYSTRLGELIIIIPACWSVHRYSLYIQVKCKLKKRGIEGWYKGDKIGMGCMVNEQI